MDASMIQLISTKVIKPSSPTPPSLKCYKLSFWDQLTTNSYMPLAAFYPNQPNNDSFYTTQISHLLERSLSILLTSYYPYAGTLVDDYTVNCDDTGATFIEARIKCSMAEILHEPDSSVQDIIFPSALTWSPVNKDKLVVAQLTHFNCGGKALSLCITHKLGDGFTMVSFLRDWAALALQDTNIEQLSPQFNGASIFPPKDTHIAPAFEHTGYELCAGRRFTFDGKIIAQLKELVAAESGVVNPTRVEVITAFLWKRSMAASMVNSGKFVPSVLALLVNLRGHKTMPPLPQNYTGNAFTAFHIPIVDQGEMKLSRLVSKIRKSKIEFHEKCKRMNLEDIILLEHLEYSRKSREVPPFQGMDIYTCSSACKFPLNNLDFGWGKPVKLSTGTVPKKNYFTLIDDNNGDGIEAAVTLDEKVMSIFQSDKELQALFST